jgi:hypothetical protein
LKTMTHPVLGDVRYSSVPMSVVPDKQVEQAIGQMSRYAIEDSRRDPVIADALSATRAAGGDPITGAWQRAKKRIRFVEDQNVITSPDVVEVLIRPVDVCLIDASMGPGSVIGDCDDFSMFVASLLLAQNIPCCFATVAADPSQPDAYSHVYVVAYEDGRRTPVDASHGKFCGWEAPNRYGKMREWDLFASARACSSGAGSLFWLLALGAAAFWYVNRYGFALPDVFGD